MGFGECNFFSTINYSTIFRVFCNSVCIFHSVSLFKQILIKLPAPWLPTNLLFLSSAVGENIVLFPAPLRNKTSCKSTSPPLSGLTCYKIIFGKKQKEKWRHTWRLLSASLYANHHGGMLFLTEAERPKPCWISDFEKKYTMFWTQLFPMIQNRTIVPLWKS